jgi:hypothetical protein
MIAYGSRLRAKKRRLAIASISMLEMYHFKTDNLRRNLLFDPKYLR